jgi:hypothetical protein
VARCNRDRRRTRGQATTEQAAQGSKVHIAVDTQGHPMAVTVTPAMRVTVRRSPRSAEEVQQVTGNTIDLVYVNQATRS